MIFHVVQGAVYGFAAAVQPGPFQAYLVSQALRNGWRRALPVVLAPLLSDGPIIVLSLFVLSHIPTWWVQLLRFAGGFFILYLAVGTLWSWRDPGSRLKGDQRCRQSMLRAVFVNLLNPSPYLYWGLVTGPLLLSGWRDSSANGIGFLMGFYGVMLASLTGLLLLSAYAGQRGDKLNRRLVGLSGVALAGFGLYQIVLGIISWR